MLSSRTRWFLVCVLTFECLFSAHSALAQSITFRRVVDTNTPIPGGSGTFTQLDRRPSVRGGNVAFRADGADGQIGAYTEIGGVLGVVADTNTMIPGGSGTFTGFSFITGGPISFDGVSVVFRGLGSSDQDGLYTDQGGALRVVADTNTPVPGGAGTFGGFRRDPSIDAGNIAFAGGELNSISADGVYTEIGGVLSVVADSSTQVPGGTEIFSGFDVVSMDGSDMAFRAFSPSSIWLITHIGGTFDVVMDVNTILPGDTLPVNTFGAAAIDKGNVVVIGGRDGDLAGIYTDLGGTLRIVADKNTPIPSGTGNFTSFFFGPVASIDNGNIVFMGAGIDGAGVYAEFLGSLVKIVDRSDSLGGDIPASLDKGIESVDGNDIAFWAAFPDGSEAIFVATIPLDTCGNGILESGEECDGQGESPDCDPDCSFASCGDGTLNTSAGESCDDGPGNSDTISDGCRTDCSLASCGDGVLDAGEACDDGNTIAGDGCQGNCLLPACGDGVVDPGEQCDDGNRIHGDGCQGNCRFPSCGDRILDVGEQCDDGNTFNGDGCSSNCVRESSGDSVPTVSQWGLVIMSLLLAIGGKVYFRRHGSRTTKVVFAADRAK